MIDERETMFFVIKDPATQFKQLRPQHNRAAEAQSRLILLFVRESGYPTLFMHAQAIVATETEKGVVCKKVNE